MRNGPYILVVAPDDYPGKRYRERYCYEHHLVYWNATGVIPKEDEVVHHKNNDKHDNKIENLEIKKRSKHTSDHSKPAEMVECICASCGKLFQRKSRYVRSKLSLGQKQFHCSRSCIGKNIHRNKPA